MKLASVFPLGARGTEGRNQSCTKEKLPPTKPNISQEESRAIKQLKDDHSRVVLTADKGVAMVVMDRDDYTNKALQLSSDTNTYNPIPKDPINKLKNKLT